MPIGVVPASHGPSLHPATLNTVTSDIQQTHNGSHPDSSNNDAEAPLQVCPHPQKVTTGMCLVPSAFVPVSPRWPHIHGPFTAVSQDPSHSSSPGTAAASSTPGRGFPESAEGSEGARYRSRPWMATSVARHTLALQKPSSSEVTSFYEKCYKTIFSACTLINIKLRFSLMFVKFKI